MPINKVFQTPCYTVTDADGSYRYEISTLSDVEIRKEPTSETIFQGFYRENDRNPFVRTVKLYGGSSLGEGWYALGHVADSEAQYKGEIPVARYPMTLFASLFFSITSGSEQICENRSCNSCYGSNLAKRVNSVSVPARRDFQIKTIILCLTLFAAKIFPQCQNFATI